VGRDRRCLRRARSKAASRRARYRWTVLLARPLESLPLTCPNCGADRRAIAQRRRGKPGAARPSSITSASPPSHRRSPLPGDHAPGTMIPGRRRTGPRSPKQTRASSSTSVSPGNHRLLPQKAPAPLISRLPLRLQSPPKPRRSAIRHLRDARTALGCALTGPLTLASLSPCRRLRLAEAVEFPICLSRTGVSRFSGACADR
jgi:hypothetical protein